MIQKWLTFFASFILLGGFSTLTQFSAQGLESKVEKPPLFLGIGEQRLLKLHNLEKYSLGNTIVKALPLAQSKSKNSRSQNDLLLLKGVSPGYGDLWVWKRDGSIEHRSIYVKKTSLTEENLNLKKSLSELDEIEVIYTGRGIVIRGEIQTLEESSKIAAILKNHSASSKKTEEVINETTLSDLLAHKVEERLTSWLQSNESFKNLRLERMGDSFWIRGSLETHLKKAAFERQARAFFPLIQTEIQCLPDSSLTLYFRVFLLELNRNYFHNLGIQWPGQIPQAFKVTSSSIKNLAQMDLALQALEGTGNARILSNPELVVRAPGEAELFAGGELPIRNQSRTSSNVTWKKHGLTLRLNVTHASGDRVRLDIFTEVSHLAAISGEESIPSIRSNQMKTQVDASFGVPLLLSGLLQEGIRESAKGLPFLRNIPVLGHLFSSEDYLNERSELVAILYPHTSPPSSKENLQKLILPRGILPYPREWLNPRDTRILQESKDYPWNVLD